jgi:beta-galactosidase
LRRRYLSRYKLVIAPTAFLTSPELAEALRAYVSGGGTLLLGVRSGFKTPSNLVTDLPLPGLLRELVGITVTDWHALPPGISYAVAYGKEAIPASIWAEALEPDPGTEELATYTAGPFGGAAALSCHPLSAGRALYLGWYPTLQQAELLVADLADRAAVDRLDPLLPEGVPRARRGRSTSCSTSQSRRSASP